MFSILTQVFAQVRPATADSNHYTLPVLSNTADEQLDGLLLAWLCEMVELDVVVESSICRLATCSVISTFVLMLSRRQGELRCPEATC